ncbi:putative FMNH2-dependent monooxygenase [Gordonia araii NBRC 100433]|uniref:Dibenzothiophene monooxygenase n=1 Tax=Gordonia araii NBRC 100433 TaxID=1073574 RepID=G7H5Q0_9ACTN|nr:SfnB family sulfur acquisition oxidoreductase [Gordonia araii]NNG95887.1 SfnB family sulfur acquisition oxidoreductase [Gordonia araii NBRC 100433]GAB11175.1 putative FMNH2-dependent monooxygenase [Gordonia araii NBRC 100433]
MTHLISNTDDPVAGLRTASTRRIADDAEAIDVAKSLAPAFAAGAGDRDAIRVHPHDEVAALSDSGLLAITVPSRFGGADVGVATLAKVVSIIAAADPSLAQIPQSHFTFLEALRRAGSAELAGRVYPRILDGARLANAQTERSGPTVVDDSTTLRTTDDGLLLSGVKYYCTGALHADLLAVRAVAHDGGRPRKVVAYVAADAPGITVVDDWDGFGQRTTGSGTVSFDRVAVKPEQVLDFSALLETPGTYGARAQLIHAAIDTGIARGALDAVRPAVSAARPWFESTVHDAADDPYLIAQAGDLELAVRTAESLLLTAADRIDEADASGDEGRRDRVAEASLATAAAKVAAGRAARRAGAELFDFGGTRSASEKANLSRFWRDARTHTLHDPERWKLHHLGKWALSRQIPPTHTSL